MAGSNDEDGSTGGSVVECPFVARGVNDGSMADLERGRAGDKTLLELRVLDLDQKDKEEAAMRRGRGRR